ncbi:MAG: 3'(2'),5'-bisphosphate nucleotidase CysQ [Propionicimonas sp.]|uniref:3'(2'),5'-bisphosphate nucleotidase CysQ n=1 Tax=Propionicimonas sp. TaxID=1955623 RepID=UPI003D0E40A2
MTSDAALAAALAEGAGQILLGLRSGVDEVSGAAGDRLSNEYLLAELATRRPDDAVLSEEAKDDASRLDAERVWIIDPLDGTREFAERTDGAWRTDFAVHVALWQRGAGLVAGAVALPARGQVFITEPPAVLPDPRGGEVLRLAVSRSRPPELVQRIGEVLPVELVGMGSAGVKAMAVVTGEVDAYVHGGGQYEWDSAAPVAVAAAAGLHTSRLDGSPLVYNNSSPWLPDLVVCRKTDAPRLLAVLAQIEGGR